MNPTPLLFTDSVFPAFRFDVLSNDISSANAPVFLVYMCLLLTLLWSIVAAVVAPEIGLGVSGTRSCAQWIHISDSDSNVAHSQV